MIKLNKMITRGFIDSQIVSVHYTELSEHLVHCRIVTKSGFEFTGESGCLDPDVFDFEVGKKIAYDKAFNSMYEPMGFWLTQHRYENNPDFKDHLDYEVVL